MPPGLHRFVLLCLLAPWLVACSAVVVRPAQVSAPRSVQLLEHGRHSSLLLTAADQTRLRYAYADWSWYVEEEQGLVDAARALVTPSGSALGRQEVAPQQPGERLESAVGVGIGRAYAFHADAARVDALIKSLERQFNESGSAPVFRAERNLWFVPHPRPYTFGYNSNHMVADWMRELGFQVRGNPALGRWQVAQEGSEQNREHKQGDGDR